MALESIARQNFNSTSHGIEWTELPSVVQYHLLGSRRIYIDPGDDVMGVWNIYLSAYNLCSFHSSGQRFRVSINSTYGIPVFVSFRHFA